MNWISVKDRLPPYEIGIDGEKEYDYVLGCNGRHIWKGMVQYREDGTWYMYGGYILEAHEVTHWGLPEPPETETPGD